MDRAVFLTVLIVVVELIKYSLVKTYWLSCVFQSVLCCYQQSQQEVLVLSDTLF